MNEILVNIIWFVIIFLFIISTFYITWFILLIGLPLYICYYCYNKFIKKE